MRLISFLISVLFAVTAFSQNGNDIVRNDTVIYILGKSVEIPRGYRYNSVKNEITLHKDAVKWELFDNKEQAEAATNEEYKKKRSSILKSGILLVEDKDNVIFENERITASRMRYGETEVVLGCVFGGPRPEYSVIYDNYSFYAPLDDKYIYVNINFKEYRKISDTIHMALPDLVQNNFITLADKTPLINPHIADTIKVKKKKRFLLWSYYDKHTIINGLSLGFSRISSPNNVTSNGVRIDLIGSSIIAFPFSFYPYSLVPRRDINRTYREKQINLENMYHNRWDDVNGLNFSVFGSMGQNTRTNGILLAGTVNMTHRVNGLSIAGIQNFLANSNGIQIAGLWSYGYNTNGIQLSILSSSAYSISGLQTSLWNETATYMNGLQIGGYNQANAVYGLQIGIFNTTNILKGFQIGLWNKNSKRSLPLINWGF